MAQVWKFPLKDDDAAVEMPDGARVLHVATQQGELCLWALVDPDARRLTRRFLVVGTGHVVNPDGLTYLGTVQTHAERLVWHVFEVTT